MRKTAKAFVFTAVLITGIVYFTGCKTTSVIKKDYTETKQKSDDFLKMQSFTGTVLVSYDGIVLYSNAFGLTNPQNPDSAPITTDSRFEIGSITKQMTAAAIMLQVEQGKLSVEDTISKFFPDLIYGDQITVKNLLTMRSGIPESAYVSKEVIDDVETDYAAGMPESEQEKKYGCDYWIALINRHPLNFTPDKYMEYSNLNYMLLGYILEQVTGQSYEQYMQEHIFDPLEMNSTNMKTAQVDVEPFDSRDGHIPSYFNLACGNINSNVFDLNRWMDAFVKGKVVTEETVNEMTWGRMKDSLEYGYGFLYGGTKIFHSGSTIGYNTYITYDYNTKLTTIVLCNKRAGIKNAATMSQVLDTFWSRAIE